LRATDAFRHGLCDGLGWAGEARRANPAEGWRRGL